MEVRREQQAGSRRWGTWMRNDAEEEHPRLVIEA
jgi:hypothetical protein